MEDKKKRIIIAVILLIVLFTVAGSLAGAHIVNASNKNITGVENMFVDINGDGHIDYIIDAKIIINNGQENFLTGQSE